MKAIARGHVGEIEQPFLQRHDIHPGRALLRAEDEGMGGGEHAHLHKVQAALDHLR